MPLSQKLELDNSEIIIYSCLKIENEGIPDEIALMKHSRGNENKSKDFLGTSMKIKGLLKKIDENQLTS